MSLAAQARELVAAMLDADDPLSVEAAMAEAQRQVDELFVRCARVGGGGVTTIPCKTCGAMPDVVETPGRFTRWSAHCPKQHDWYRASTEEKAIEGWNISQRGEDRRGIGRQIG